MRVAGEGATAGGVTLPAGGLVTVLFGAANRDPRQFPAPGVFDLDRANADSQVAFGVGIHYCLGAALARAETRSFIESHCDTISHLFLILRTTDVIDLTGKVAVVTGVWGARSLPGL